MVIAAVDTETYTKKNGYYEPILNTNEFVLGYYLDENSKKRYFENKEEMWNFIIEEGKRINKYGQVLNVYGHNHIYDFYAYADIMNSNLKYLCESPFIVSYVHNGKEIIKFLDTFALYRSSLKKLGDIIGKPKMELPMKVRNINQLKPYLTNDTEIVLDFVQMIKGKLKEEGVNLKRLYTIQQVAIQFFLNHMKRLKNDYFFYNPDRNQVHFTKKENMIHQAYRGGRVECFRTGKLNNITYIDVNSLYPYICYNMDFPDLREQQFVEYPQENILENKIGIARCLLKNVNNNIGLLAIRTPEFSYYPKEGKLLIGTYTFDEIRKAKREGYNLISMEWAITYGKSIYNPYTDIIPTIYNKKRDATDEFDRYFYKSMLNNHLGKLAQTRVNQEIIIKNIDTALEYKKFGYDIINGIDNTRMVRLRKDCISNYNKPYYAPIIPTSVNARARIHMYEQLKKVGKNDIIYTDTDSILFSGNHLSKFNISPKMGDFKVEHENKEVLIWGRKTYMIDKEIKAAGIPKKDLTPERFERGYLETLSMNRLGTTSNSMKLGGFTKSHRDFKKQLEDYKIVQANIETMDIYIDFTIDNIEYFKEDLLGFL